MHTSPGTVVLFVTVLASVYSNATPRCSHPTTGGLTSDSSSSTICSQEISDEDTFSSEEINVLAQVLTDGRIDDSSSEMRHSEDESDQAAFLRNLRTEGHKFLRFGRDPDHKFMRFGREPDHKFIRFGRDPDHKFMRFGRIPDHKFIRFGRDPDHKFMRFGRETDRNFMRNQREPQHNFMRFGRSVDGGAQNDFSQLLQLNNPEQNFIRSARQPDHKFIRFGRQPDHKFMRFGRAYEMAANADNGNPTASNGDKLENVYQETSQRKQNV